MVRTSQKHVLMPEPLPGMMRQGYLAALNGAANLTLHPFDANQGHEN